LGYDSAGKLEKVKGSSTKEAPPMRPGLSAIFSVVFLFASISQSAGQSNKTEEKSGTKQKALSDDHQICAPPSCISVFGHPHRIDQSRSSATPSTSQQTTNSLPARTKMVVEAEGTRIFPSHDVYEKCLPPSCYLIYTWLPVSSTRRVPRVAFTSREGPIKTNRFPLVFVASDGSIIFPEFDNNGNVTGATGRDVNGADREIHFSTTIDSQYVPFQHPIPYIDGVGNCQIQGNILICEQYTIPPGCDSFGCNVYKTTMTATYYEQSTPKFTLTMITDPFNYEAELGTARILEKVVIPTPHKPFVQSLRYVMKLDGTGEEHVVDSQGNDVITNFTIDRQHGNAFSITPKFGTLFPEMAGATYFWQVFNYMFIHQPLISDGQSLFDLSGGQSAPPTQNWGGRLAGDLLITLVASGACFEMGPACMLSASTAAAGTDFWELTSPGVQNPDGSSTADKILQMWLEGLCSGIDSVWEFTVGNAPKIFCH
jgi:hypothetical protein